MNKRKANLLKKKIILSAIIACFIAVMLWLYRETLKDNIVPEYGIEPYDEALEAGKVCEPTS